MSGRASRLTPNLEGALWVLASAVSFTGMSTLVKFLGDDYPAMLQNFYRQFAGFIILMPLILKRRSAAFATTRPWFLAFRAAMATTGMILAFYAFQKMPLADANALSFTRTLWVVLLAALFMGEKVGPLRIGATAVGFGGVVMMLASQLSGSLTFGLPALAMLASSLVLAIALVGMKSISRDHSTTALMVWSAGLGFLFSIPGALLAWRWPTLVDLGLLSLMGVLATGTFALYAKGLQVGDAAAMAPVDYSRLVFATLFGFLFFHELPGLWTILGAAVVVGSTLFITWREHQQTRRADAAAASAL